MKEYQRRLIMVFVTDDVELHYLKTREILKKKRENNDFNCLSQDGIERCLT